MSYGKNIIKGRTMNIDEQISNIILEAEKEDNALEEYANEIAQRQKDRISSDIIRLTNNIEQIAADAPKAVIPEIVFTNYFLNFFFNIATGQGDVNEGLMLKWLELANGWYNEVNVIDTQGNVLFTVPSLYRTNIISHEHLKNVNFTMLGRIYKTRATRTPEEGLNVLYEEFAKLPKCLFPDENNELGLIWRSIFVRYGLLASPEDQAQQKSKIAQTSEQQARAKLEDLGIIED